VNLVALIKGGPLPERLDLPRHLEQQFERLWQRSTAFQTEWGLTLTVDRAGRVHGRHAQGGTFQDFVPDLVVPRGERLLGAFHTHVYADGSVGMAFSDYDFVAVIAQLDLHVSLLLSGSTLFALVRTPVTVSVAPPNFVGGNGQFYGQVLAFYEAEATRTYQEALWQTNLYFCREFGLAFYQGELFQPLEAVFRP
jgi:hypothetical protein